MVVIHAKIAKFLTRLRVKWSTQSLAVCAWMDIMVTLLKEHALHVMPKIAKNALQACATIAWMVTHLTVYLENAILAETTVYNVELTCVTAVQQTMKYKMVFVCSLVTVVITVILANVVDSAKFAKQDITLGLVPTENV
jgi:hypothetical protein